MQRIPAPTGRPVTLASRGMVATPHYLAAQAGVWALEQGGNAIDAAIAANATLAVVYPHMAGLGGDAFLIVWHPGRPQPICLNGSGHSGYQASIQFYLDRGHEAIPAHGPLAANTVPGAVAAWGDAHTRWGRLPWEQLFTPAITYAEGGFPVSSNLAMWLERARPILERYPSSRQVFLPEGEPLRQGQVLLQRDLAQTLRTIAEDGPKALYLGDIGLEIVRFLEEHGGALSFQDLKEHHSDWVDPLKVEYRGRSVYGFPPNSQGVAALFLLNLLEGFDMAGVVEGSAQYYHLLVEATKVTLADLRGRIADPSYVTLPVEQLISAEYAARRRALILPQRARPLGEYASGVLLGEEFCPLAPVAPSATAYIATADADGYAVSLVQSLHSEFGSGVVAGRTGILLHNAGAAFTLEPRDPNRLEPHKRPSEPLMPGLAFDGGSPWLIFGASGGEAQLQTFAALATRMVDYGYNIQQAIEAPRWLYTPGRTGEPELLSIEGRVPDSVLRQLREMGHDVRVTSDWTDAMGQAQGIVVDAEHGVFHGGADPRGDGQALGW